ncbi:L,D-transpeptidase family protein [Sulfitobacter noctilucicola]|nr:L,D-transpeptidase family protein [Sulfitobacter noctilucicola]
MVLTPTGLRFRGDKYPCSIGKGGLSLRKKEGDGATPRGIHRIVGMLYRPDRIPPPTDWALPIGRGDLWSDDPTHEDYNMMVRAPYLYSHEKLRRADPLYDLVILTDWNWPYAVKGRGSAIFMHQWRRPGYPTEGCIALSRADLHRLAPKIEHRTRLIVP